MKTGRLLWRDSLDAPAASMMATQVQLALRIRGGLAPLLGGSVEGGLAEPKNEEAYTAFLRSTALASDPGPNRQGIDLLRRAVALDDSYAPAWHALSKRYRLLLACAARRSAAEVGRLAAEIRPSDDPEGNYLSAAHLSYCGDPAAAAKLLMRAVEGNYCSYPAMTRDPMMATLRSSSHYAAVETAGRQCSDHFRAVMASRQRSSRTGQL